MSAENCWCGRAKGHTGRHTGASPHKKPGPEKRIFSGGAKFLASIATEIERCDREIATCRALIARTNARIKVAEARRAALRPVQDAYGDRLALPAPAASLDAISASSLRPLDTPPEPARTVDAAKPRAATSVLTEASKISVGLPRRGPGRPPDAPRDDPDATDADFEPVEVSWVALSAWANENQVRCRSWDDLPSVNAKRERMSLPAFKRQLPGRSMHNASKHVSV